MEIHLASATLALASSGVKEKLKRNLRNSRLRLRNRKLKLVMSKLETLSLIKPSS